MRGRALLLIESKAPSLFLSYFSLIEKYTLFRIFRSWVSASSATLNFDCRYFASCAFAPRVETRPFFSLKASFTVPTSTSTTWISLTACDSSLHIPNSAFRRVTRLIRSRTMCSKLSSLSLPVYFYPVSCFYYTTTLLIAVVSVAGDYPAISSIDTYTKDISAVRKY